MIPGFTWRIPARVARVIDGDTVVLKDLDLGFLTSRASLPGDEQHVRLLDLWCAERYTDEGKVAKAFVENLLPPDTVVIYHSVVWKQTLGRALGYIELMDGTDLSTLVRDAGLGTLTKPTV